MNFPSKEFLVNWMIFVSVFVVSFIAGELILRALPVSDRMGANLVPSVEERVGSAGSKPMQGVRILALGDSFTEWRDTSGDNYARVAAASLHDRLQPVDLVNLGQGGTGLFDYFSNLIRYGDRLAPDLVVIGIYIGNDVAASPWRIGSPDSVEAARRAGRENDENGGLKQVLKRSIALNYTYRVAKRFVPPLRSDRLEQIVAQLQQQSGRDDEYVAQRLAEADPVLVDAARADAINVWDLAAALFFPRYYADLAAGTPAGQSVDGFLADLSGFVEYCRARGYAVVAVLIPPSVWVSERYHDYFHRLGYTDLGPVTGEVPVLRRVNEALAGQQVPTLDLLPILRAVNEEIFIENDIHLNRRGHEIAGRALARLLIDVWPRLGDTH